MVAPTVAQELKVANRAATMAVFIVSPSFYALDETKCTKTRFRGWVDWRRWERKRKTTVTLETGEVASEEWNWVKVDLKGKKS